MTEDYTIFILEDDEQTLKLIDIYFSKEGIRNYFLCDSKRGFSEAIKDKKADIVCIDHFLPGSDGQEVTRELLELRPDAHVIISSGNDDNDITIQYIKLGVNDYVKKTDNYVHELLEAVKKAIAKIKKQKQEWKNYL